jgi:nitroreductase
MTTNSPADFSQRDPLDSVNEMFSKRWSPRAFTPTPVTDQQLQTVLEAARWSPSCFNAQPWQFITSTPETHDQFLALLADLNQAWAKNASVIGFIVAEKNFAHNGNSNTFASFDCGAAWMAMTLQAQQLGLYTHGMGGINYDEVYKTFNLDVETHQVVCGFALGSIGDVESLPEAFREKEKPTPRKALSDMWRQGI